MSYGASDEVAEDFKLALEDLTMNSRYEISNLTVIAKENTEHALAISDALKDHIKKVSVAGDDPSPAIAHIHCDHRHRGHTIFERQLTIFRLVQRESCQPFTYSIRSQRMSERLTPCSSEDNSSVHSWSPMPWSMATPVERWRRC